MSGPSAFGLRKSEEGDGVQDSREIGTQSLDHGARHGELRRRCRRCSLGPARDGRRASLRRHRSRGGSELVRHRRCVLGRCVGAHAWRGHQRPTRRAADLDQGTVPFWAGSQRRRAIAPPHHHELRGEPSPLAHRLDRPLPGARVGWHDAARGNLRSAGRPRAHGQSAISRMLQLRRLAAHEGARRCRASGLRPLREPADLLLGAQPRS